MTRRPSRHGSMLRMPGHPPSTSAWSRGSIEGVFLAAMALGGRISTATKKEISIHSSSDTAGSGSSERMNVDASLLEGLRHVGPLHYLRLTIFLFLYVGTAGAAIWMAQEFRGSAWIYAANIPF